MDEQKVQVVEDAIVIETPNTKITMSREELEKAIKDYKEAIESRQADIAKYKERLKLLPEAKPIETPVEKVIVK